MRRTLIEEYDNLKLVKARELIESVFNYYYGEPGYKKITNRLDTILSKIDDVIILGESEK